MSSRWPQREDVLNTDFGVILLPQPLPVRLTRLGKPDRRYKEASLVVEYIENVNASAMQAYVNGQDARVAMPYFVWKATRSV